MSGARNGLRDRLRQATRLSHDRLDAALDLLGPPVTLAEYRALLGRHHGIHRALEPVLTRTLEHALVAGRGKLAALDHDLGTCGLTADQIAALPILDFLPPAGGRSDGLGLLYVVEGSTLGGQVIARHLRRNPAIPAAAFRYMEIYGGETGARWRQVCATLESVNDPALQERLIDAATAMFAALEQWLAPRHWRNGTQETDGGRDRD